jgi:hypothetical protein
MSMSAAERKQAERNRKRAQGLFLVQYWLNTEEKQAVDRYIDLVVQSRRIREHQADEMMCLDPDDLPF